MNMRVEKLKLVLAITIGLVISCVFSATETVNGITWTYTVRNGVASVGDGSASTAVPKATIGTIKIPLTLGGYSVASIGPYAFRNCSGLTNVMIPDCVASIGNDAFSGCSGLTSVTIPDGVTSIGGVAFYNCSGLTSVTIPRSVTSIGGSAFSGCSGLTSVHIFDIGDWCRISFGNMSANPLYYAHNLYLGDTLIVDLVIPDNVTSIMDYAFYSCSGLTSVTIPNGVGSIGHYAFYECNGLKSVAMPSSVTNVSYTSFCYCPAYDVNLCRLAFDGVEYSLANAPMDRAIASIKVEEDCCIDYFVLKNGKVYDSLLYVSNAVNHAVTLTLPSNYVYKVIKGTKPFDIPAKSESILSITRIADDVFLVAREDLDTFNANSQSHSESKTP